MSITLPSFLFVFFSMFRKLLQRNLYSKDTLGINANVPPKHVCVGGYLKRGWIGVCSYLSFFFIYHTHDDFDIADPSSTQDACHRWTARLESFVAQWLEHPTGVRELIGSIPVGDSRVFSWSRARDMLIALRLNKGNIFIFLFCLWICCSH